MSKANKLLDRVCADNLGIFQHDGQVLFCVVCDEKVNVKQISQVTQHIQTAKHARNNQRKSKKADSRVQTLLTDEYIDTLSPAELEAFKYAPAVSCDVERTFSDYKLVLEDTRRSFVFDNLRKHVIIHCNKFNI